jgi:hypothetical protein
MSERRLPPDDCLWACVADVINRCNAVQCRDCPFKAPADAPAKNSKTDLNDYLARAAIGGAND